MFYLGKVKLENNQQIHIRKLSPKDKVHTDKIVNIFSDSLGIGYITKENIEKILNKESKQILLIAFLNKEIVAVIIVKVLSQKETIEFEQEVKIVGFSIHLSSNKVGMLVSQSVQKEFRRQGIGLRMIKEGIKELKKNRCTICIATAWDSGAIESSPKLLEAIGFEKIATLKNYWEKESLIQGYECPKCGKPPCTCSAFLYKYNIT